MLPQSPSDTALKRRAANLVWLHSTESTRRLYKLVESGPRPDPEGDDLTAWRALAGLVLGALPGGAAARRPVRRSVRQGGMVGLDAGLSHLATLDRVVRGVTDDAGHVANPRVLEGQLKRLGELDRAWARAQKGSKNQATLRRRRARLHGKVAKTRALHLHHLTNALVDRFDAVAIEDLSVAAMSNAKHHLGRLNGRCQLGRAARSAHLQVQ